MHFKPSNHGEVASMNEEEHQSIEKQRATFRESCGVHIGASNIQYPPHLKVLSKFMTLNWLDDALQIVAQHGE